MDDKQILDLYWERSEAAISETSKNTQVLHQCSLLWESELTMPRCYLKQQPIPSMKFLKSSGMIISFISAGFSTS